jgi:preprotein translocase subunit SecG
MNIWYWICLAVEAVLSFLLILFILLHAPKGEGMGGIGGSATLFTGKRGAEAGLDRLTWIIFGLFMSICVLLGFGFIRPN